MSKSRSISILGKRIDEAFARIRHDQTRMDKYNIDSSDISPSSSSLSSSSSSVSSLEWSWKKATSPRKPLVAKNGRVPRVGLVIITNIKAHWNIEHSLSALFARMRYLESLFEGCDVDRLLRYNDYGDIPDDVNMEWSNELERWTLFNSKNGDIYDYVYNHKYDFVLFMNVFPDNSIVGMEYGLPECIIQRYTLRACMMSSGGNALFGDWGIPNDYPYEKVRDEMNDVALASFFDGSGYQYRDTSRDRYAFADYTPNPQRPLARLIRLGRYIRPISIEKEELSESVINLIHAAVRGDAFNRNNLWATWWASYNGLLFPYDLLDSSAYHGWKSYPSIQVVQDWIAHAYLDAVNWYYNSHEEDKMEAFLMIVDAVVWWIKVTVVIFFLHLFIQAV